MLTFEEQIATVVCSRLFKRALNLVVLNLPTILCHGHNSHVQMSACIWKRNEGINVIACLHRLFFSSHPYQYIAENIKYVELRQKNVPSWNAPFMKLYKFLLSPSKCALTTNDNGVFVSNLTKTKCPQSLIQSILTGRIFVKMFHNSSWATNLVCIFIYNMYVMKPPRQYIVHSFSRFGTASSQAQWHVETHVSPSR